MTWKLSASAILLMQHMDVCSSFKPARIAFLFFVAKSILMGTNRSQDFSQEISSLVEKQNLCLEHRRRTCLAYIDGKHCHLVRHFIYSKLADGTWASFDALEIIEEDCKLTPSLPQRLEDWPAKPDKVYPRKLLFLISALPGT